MEPLTCGRPSQDRSRRFVGPLRAQPPSGRRLLRSNPAPSRCLTGGSGVRIYNCVLGPANRSGLFVAGQRLRGTVPPCPVPDPRARRGARYPLTDVLLLFVAAVLDGARSLTMVAEWAARAHRDPHLFERGSTRRWPRCTGSLP